MNGRIKPKFTGCYIGDENCCNEITKEHVISKSILQELGPMTYKIGDKFIKLGNSAVLPYLCKYHNNALSPFDDEAFKFVSSWNKITSNMPDQSGMVKYDFFNETSTNQDGKKVRLEALKIDTKKFELWMLKTFFNMIWQRAILDEDQKPFFKPNIDKIAGHLFNGVPVEPPFGIYQLLPGKGFSTKSNWSFSPQFKEIWY